MPRLAAATSFRLFRYQINAVKKDIQGDFHKNITSIDELIQRKNDVFADVLSKIKEIKFKRAPISHHVDQINSMLIMQIGANRPVKVTTKDFHQKEVENWPALTVAFDNRSDKQFAAVELKQEAFRYAETVIGMLEANINRELKQFQLIAQFEPLFEKEDFWRVIRINTGQISYVKFFMVEPNLPDLSKNLSDSLKAATKRINSNRFNLGFHSPPDESLQISRDDNDINGLVEYSAGGGGTAHVKIKGVRAVYKTNDTSRTIQIDEIHLTGEYDPEDIARAIRLALDDVQ